MTSTLSKLRTYNRPTNGLAWVREAERLLAEAYERPDGEELTTSDATGRVWHIVPQYGHPGLVHAFTGNDSDGAYLGKGESTSSLPVEVLRLVAIVEAGWHGRRPDGRVLSTDSLPSDERPVDAATREDADDKGPQHSTLCRFPNWSTKPVVRVEARDGALWFPDLIPDNRGPMAREDVVEAFERWGETPDGWGKALRFLDFRCPPLPCADEPIERAAEQSSAGDCDTCHGRGFNGHPDDPAGGCFDCNGTGAAKDSLTAETGDDDVDELDRFSDALAEAKGWHHTTLPLGYAYEAFIAWQSERAQRVEEIARLKRELDRYKEVIAMIDGAAKGDSVGLLSRAEKAEARVRELIGERGSEDEP